MTLAQAIAREEGFGMPHSRATRNNNPGNIEWGGFARAHGATRVEDAVPHITPRFAYFPSSEQGFAAMTALLQHYYGSMTLEQMLNRYAPPVENQTNAYIAYVCKCLGCGPGDVVGTLL